MGRLGEQEIRKPGVASRSMDRELPEQKKHDVFEGKLSRGAITICRVHAYIKAITNFLPVALRQDVVEWGEDDGSEPRLWAEDTAGFFYNMFSWKVGLKSWNNTCP